MNKNILKKKFEDDWIGSLPDKWSRKKLKYITKYNTEVLDSNSLADYEFNYIEINDVNLISGISLSDKIKFRDSPSRARRIIKSDDIIISTVRTYLKSISIVPDLPDLICSTGFCVLRSERDKLEPLFLYFNVISQWFIERIISESKGVSYPAINPIDLVQLEITLPPIKEQKLISQYLDKKINQIDLLVEKIEKKIELLNEQKITLINQYVTKGVDPDVEMKDSEVEWIGEIPKNWKRTNLKYLVELISGFAFKSSDYVEEGIQLIKIGNLYQNRLDLNRSPNFLNTCFMRSHENFLIRKDDLLISLTGTLGKRDYGFVCQYSLEKLALLNQRVGKIVIKNKNLLKEFAFFYMRSEFYQSQIFKKPTGTKQGNFSSEDILSNIIFLPDIKIQERIVKKLSFKEIQFNKLVKLHQNKIKKLQEYRQSLISSVVTGKIPIAEEML